VSRYPIKGQRSRTRKCRHRFLLITSSHMVRFTSSRDNNVLVPGPGTLAVPRTAYFSCFLLFLLYSSTQPHSHYFSPVFSHCHLPLLGVDAKFNGRKSA